MNTGLSGLSGLSGLVGGGSSPAAFAPSDLGAQLLMHRDATVAASLWQDTAETTAAASDGDPAGRIKDQSGNGHHFDQTVSGSKAVLKLAVQNGLNAVRMDGLDDLYDLAAVLAQADGHTYYLVCDTTSLGTGYRPCLNRDLPFSGPACELGFSANDYKPGVFWGGSDRAIWGTAIQKRAVFRFSIPSQTACGIRVDGGTEVTATFASQAYNNWATFGFGTVELAIDFCEDLLVDTPTAQQDTDIKTYLNAKWGTPI